MELRVLIADGDRSLTTVYQSFLSRHGMEVSVAASGAECLRMVRNLRPDFLVLDSDLSGVGADAVLTYLRGDAACGATSVVLVADDSAETLAELVVAPVVASLRKPFRLRALLNLLRAAETAPVAQNFAS